MSTEELPIPELIEAAVRRRELSPSAASNLKTWLDGPAGREDLASRERVLTALKNNDAAWLEPLFWEVIPFGTGGRRGPMADFGTATLNRRTVAESAEGLARYLRSQNDAQTEQTVIIAYDSRHRSEEFARLTATVSGRTRVECPAVSRAAGDAGALVRRSSLAVRGRRHDFGLAQSAVRQWRQNVLVGRWPSAPAARPGHHRCRHDGESDSPG
jgi:hypothetical protein